MDKVKATRRILVLGPASSGRTILVHYLIESAAFSQIAEYRIKSSVGGKIYEIAGGYGEHDTELTEMEISSNDDFELTNLKCDII